MGLSMRSGQLTGPYIGKKIDYIKHPRVTEHLAGKWWSVKLERVSSCTVAIWPPSPQSPCKRLEQSELKLASVETLGGELQ
jgi:hypothetical protein